MKRILLLAALSLLSGCRTHLSLRDNTLQVGSTLTDLTYQQVLNNVALFEANPASLPAFSLVNAGTVTVADGQSFTGNATYAPTLTFTQQGGGALPILSLLFNPGSSRTLTENWSLIPVTDADHLRRIRCAFQLLVLGDNPPTACDDCRGLLEDFYLGEPSPWECQIPQGWYGSGSRKDVPKNACYVGHHGDTYVWVMSEGVEGLTRFSLTVLDLATGKPHAPTKTVVKTLKPDGTLDHTEVTTTEIDREALERMKKEPRYQDRPRRTDTGGQINPGLFFVPGS
jgi:hypothetical protein